MRGGSWGSLGACRGGRGAGGGEGPGGPGRGVAGGSGGVGGGGGGGGAGQGPAAMARPLYDDRTGVAPGARGAALRPLFSAAPADVRAGLGPPWRPAASRGAHRPRV